MSRITCTLPVEISAAETHVVKPVLTRFSAQSEFIWKMFDINTTTLTSVSQTE